MSEKAGILTLSLFVTGYCVGYVSILFPSNLKFSDPLLQPDSMGTFVRTVWSSTNIHIPLARVHRKVAMIIT